MSTLKRPKLLLLDEHTAALDPKTARKVLELTEEMVNEQHLTALMVTHNMKDAIQIGNRLIMMNSGHVIYDVEGEEKKKLTVEDLLAKFSEASGEEFSKRPCDCFKIENANIFCCLRGRIHMVYSLSGNILIFLIYLIVCSFFDRVYVILIHKVRIGCCGCREMVGCVSIAGSRNDRRNRKEENGTIYLV